MTRVRGYRFAIAAGAPQQQKFRGCVLFLLAFDPPLQYAISLAIEQQVAGDACTISDKPDRCSQPGAGVRAAFSTPVPELRSGGLRMRTLAPVLCTSGLAAEARIARAAGFQVIVGAGDPGRTAALVRDAVRDAKCLISFGVAGGLAPHMRPGDVILSSEVIDDDRRWSPGDAFQRQVADMAREIGAIDGPVLGWRTIIANEQDKAKAWRQTGAIAVDMESAIVARAAAAASIPFLVLRTVADSPTRALPPAALIPLTKEGTPAFGRVLREVLRRPRQIGALFGLALETRQALTALAGPARALRTALAAA
jgi:hopanoid-associated phosphorylase